MGNSQMSTYRVPGDDEYRPEKDQRASCQPANASESPKIDCREIMRRLNRASASLPEISCDECCRNPRVVCPIPPSPQSLGSPCHSINPFPNNGVCAGSCLPNSALNNCPASRISRPSRRLYLSDCNMNPILGRCSNCGQNPFQHLRSYRTSFPGLTFTPEQMQNPCVQALVDAMQNPRYNYNRPSNGFNGASAPPENGNEMGNNCNESPGSDPAGTSVPYNQSDNPGSSGSNLTPSSNGNPVPMPGSGPAGLNSRNPWSPDPCQDLIPPLKQPNGIPLTETPYAYTNGNPWDPNRTGTKGNAPGSSPNQWNPSVTNPGSGSTATPGPYGTYPQNPSSNDACKDVDTQTTPIGGPTYNTPYQTRPNPYDANTPGTQGQRQGPGTSPNSWKPSGANPDDPNRVGTPGKVPGFSSNQWNPSGTNPGDPSRAGSPGNAPGLSPNQWNPSGSNPGDPNRTGTPGNSPGSSPNQWNPSGSNPGDPNRTGTPGNSPGSSPNQWSPSGSNPGDQNRTETPGNYPGLSSNQWNPSGTNPGDPSRAGSPGNAPGLSPNQWNPSGVNPGDPNRAGPPGNVPGLSSNQWNPSGSNPGDSNRAGASGNPPGSSPNQWNPSGANPGDPTRTGSPGNVPGLSSNQWNPSNANPGDPNTAGSPGNAPNKTGVPGNAPGLSPNQRNLSGSNPPSGPLAASGPSGTYSQNPSSADDYKDVVTQTNPTDGPTDYNPYRTSPNIPNANKSGTPGQGQGPSAEPNPLNPSGVNPGSKPTATAGPFNTSSRSPNGTEKPAVGLKDNIPYGTTTSGDPWNMNGPGVQGQNPGSLNQSKPFSSDDPSGKQKFPNSSPSSNSPGYPGVVGNRNSYPPGAGNSDNDSPKGSETRSPTPDRTSGRQGANVIDPNVSQGNKFPSNGGPKDASTETSGPDSDLNQVPGKTNPTKSKTGGVPNNGPMANNDRNPPNFSKTSDGNPGLSPDARNDVGPKKSQFQPGNQSPNLLSPDGPAGGYGNTPEGQGRNRELNPRSDPSGKVPSKGLPNSGTTNPTIDTKPGKANFDPSNKLNGPTDNAIGPDTGTQTDFPPEDENGFFTNGGNEAPLSGSGGNPADDRDKNRPTARVRPSDHNEGYGNNGLTPDGTALKTAPSAEPNTGKGSGNGPGSYPDNSGSRLKPGNRNPNDGSSTVPKGFSPNGAQGKVDPNLDGEKQNPGKGNSPKKVPSGKTGLNNGRNSGNSENQPGLATGTGQPGLSGSDQGYPSGDTKLGNKPNGQGQVPFTGSKSPSSANVSSGNSPANNGLKTPSKQKFKRKEGEPSRVDLKPDNESTDQPSDPDSTGSKKPNGGRKNGRNSNGGVGNRPGNDDPSLGLGFPPDGQSTGSGRPGKEEPGKALIKKVVKPSASTQTMEDGPEVITEPYQTSGTGQNDIGSEIPITGRKKTGQRNSTNQPPKQPENCDDKPGKGLTKPKNKNPNTRSVKTPDSCTPPPRGKTDRATHSANDQQDGKNDKRPRSKARPCSPLYYAPPFTCLTPEMYLPNHVSRLMKRCQSAGTNTCIPSRPLVNCKPRENKSSKDSDGYRHIRRLKSDGGRKLCTTDDKFSPFYFGPSYTLQPLKLKPSAIKIQPRSSCEVVCRTKSQTEAYLKCSVPESPKRGGQRRPVSVPVSANKQPGQCTPSNLKRPATPKSTPAATSNPKPTMSLGPENTKYYGNRNKDLRRTRSVSASKMNSGGLNKKPSQSSCNSGNGNQPEKSILKKLPSKNKRKLKKSISFEEELCYKVCPPPKATKLKKKRVKTATKFNFHVDPVGLNDDDDLVDDEPCTYTIQGTPYTPAFTIPIPARNAEGFFLLKSEFDKFLERYACVIRAAQDAELSKLPYTPPVTGGGGPKGSGQCSPAACAAGQQQCPTPASACTTPATTPMCSTPCTPTSPMGQVPCAGTYGIYTLDQFGLPKFAPRLKKLESDDSLAATEKLQDIGLFTIAKPGSGTSKMALSPTSERSDTIIDTDNNDLDFIPNEDDWEVDAIINQILRETSMESERNIVAEESPPSPAYTDEDLICIDEILDRPSMSNFFENSIESFLGQSVISTSSGRAMQGPTRGIEVEVELPDPDSTLSDQELELVTQRLQIVFDELPVDMGNDDQHTENLTVQANTEELQDEEESAADADLEKKSMEQPGDDPITSNLKADEEPKPLVSVLKKRSVVCNPSLGFGLSPAASKSKESRVTFSPDAPEVKIFDGEIQSPASSDFSLGPPPPRPEGLGAQSEQPVEAARVSRSRSTTCIAGNKDTPTSEYYLSMFRNPRRYDTFRSSSDAGSPEAQLLTTLNRPSSSDSNLGAAAEAQVIETPMNASLDSVLEARVKQSAAEEKIDKLVHKISTRQSAPAEDQ